jgi:hypothetical protein
MPHQSTVSHQASSENIPNLSNATRSDAEPQQLEAGLGEHPELNEKDTGSGISTPSALLPPKNGEATSENAHREPGSEFVVWWEEPANQDPENPLNWSSRKKWLNIMTISVISFLV